MACTLIAMTMFSASALVSSVAQAQIPAPPLSGVTGTKEAAVGGDTARTRFVIGLEKAVEFQVSSISNPNRVFIDMPEVKLQLPTITGSAAIGLVKSFYGGQSAPGKTRVVIDVTGPVIVETAVIEKAKDGKPARLVLEIVPVDAKGTAARKVALAAQMASALRRRRRPRRSSPSARRRASAPCPNPSSSSIRAMAGMTPAP